MDPELRTFLLHFNTLAEAAAETLEANHEGEQLCDALAGHLGRDAGGLPLVLEEFGGHRLADASLILSSAGDVRRVVGLAAEERHFMGLADLLMNRRHINAQIVEPDYRTVAVGPEENLRIIDNGVFLLSGEFGLLAVYLRGPNPQSGRPSATLEVLGDDPSRVDGFIGWFRAQLRSQSIYRGHVVSFTPHEFEPSTGGITFHRRPQLEREQVILPAGVLEEVQRHVVELGRHRDALLASGQHLKRGVLLYGPPGTGKTHTVRYLLSGTAGTTAILLSAGSLSLVAEAARMARALQPAIVVLEDCDLVAGDRGFDGGSRPLLFELLEAMDGLDPDADVAFVLTTNRVEDLERALAQRPGRVDLAVEIPLPGVVQRRALIDLYAGPLGFSEEARDAAAEATEGTTASFTKELVRRTVLAAALEDRNPTDADLAAGVDGLMSAGAVLTRRLLGAGADADEDDGEVDFGGTADHLGPATFGWFPGATGGSPAPGFDGGGEDAAGWRPPGAGPDGS